jgi:hypothetical protein
MELNTNMLLEELTQMAHEDIKKCFSEQVVGFAWDMATTTSCIDESVFPPPFVPAQEVEVTNVYECRLFTDDTEAVACATASSDHAPNQCGLTTTCSSASGTMELHIGEKIDECGKTCALCVAVYTSGKTIVFGRESFNIDINNAPVFDADTDNLIVKLVFDVEMFVDTELDDDNLGDKLIYDIDFDDLDEETRVTTKPCPNHVVVVVVKFKPKYDVELTIFDDRPISVEEASIDPIFDVAPDYDHAAVTVLNITNSLDFNIFHKGLNDISVTRTGVVLDENSLFDEEPGLEEVDLITAAKEFILSSNITAMTITKDAPFACLIKF